jgi:hypothetical protein
MAYDNTNRWTLNKNDRKQQDSHADYQGKINVEGKDYWLNGWIKDGPNGKFISGTIKAVGEQQRQAPAPARGSSRNDDMDDSIPFAPEVR